MNGLDLFSGIGGISEGLKPWVRTIAYCERDRYAQGVLMSRMRSGDIDRGPIWDDVRTLSACQFATEVDVIFGGFPCQDISTAGRGAGLAGERSGLFFDVVRLVDDLRPSFVFLENVPAITTRGGLQVAGAFTELGYDCRWTIVSAEELGAAHLRKRWFLLAHSNGSRKSSSAEGWNKSRNESLDSGEDLADTEGERRREGRTELSSRQRFYEPTRGGRTFDIRDWLTEPDVGRMVNGLPNRVDRIRCLGNAVVPVVAREAFKRLSGLGN